MWVLLVALFTPSQSPLVHVLCAFSSVATDLRYNAFASQRLSAGLLLNASRPLRNTSKIHGDRATSTINLTAAYFVFKDLKLIREVLDYGHEFAANNWVL